MERRHTVISLGQGVGPIAQARIKIAKQSGEWVLLENCHLCLSWMRKLDKICDEFDDNSINPNFRLWLTTNSTPKFAIGIL